MIEGAKQFLDSSRGPDGGWGYLVGQQSAVEPTSAVALGLARVTGASSLREAALG